MFKSISSKLAVLCSSALCIAATSVQARDFKNPFELSSGRSDELSVLIVAKAQTEPLRSPTAGEPDSRTIVWAYEICRRPAGPAPMACPAGTGHGGLLGVRLDLKPGDTLRMRLVNDLPCSDQFKHATTDDHNPASPAVPELALNPTNLHTHGLVVLPTNGDTNGGIFGDYIFTEVDNPNNIAGKNGCPDVPPMPSTHAAHATSVGKGAIEYRIKLDSNHVAGTFWMHPHVHGVALNQVTAGLSALITIGKDEDACRDPDDKACHATLAATTHRYMMLRDFQLDAEGSVKIAGTDGRLLLTQQDAGFCDAQPTAGEDRKGLCKQTGGKPGVWMHTLNGQRYPSIEVAPKGEVWSIINSAASRSYDLSLRAVGTGSPAPPLFHVLAVDGVPLDGTTLATPDDKARMLAKLGTKFVPVACDDAASQNQQAEICARSLRLMPSARVDVRVIRRDGDPRDTAVVLQTSHYPTGDPNAGDDWPQVDLAAVTLKARANSTPPPPRLVVGGSAERALSSAGMLGSPATIVMPGRNLPVSLDTARNGRAQLKGLLGKAPTAMAVHDYETKVGIVAHEACVPLQPGTRRQIFFGKDANSPLDKDTFAIGHRVLDSATDKVVGPDALVVAFDPAYPSKPEQPKNICVVLGKDGIASEEWEIINLTAEDHNFHIHQTRFELLAGDGTAAPKRVVLHDNVPLPRAQGAQPHNCDGSLAKYLAKECVPAPVRVRITFNKPGDFVYHCHILEHEDGGMMAKISVVGSPTQ